MASVSVSHLILFIASMVVAASVAGVFATSVGEISGAVSDRSVDVSNQVRTDVEIISDAGSSALYNDTGAENLTLYVKNTGSRSLDPASSQFDLFVDGQYVTATTVTHVDGEANWRPGQVVKVEISVALGPGDHRVKLVADGDEEVFIFHL